MSLKTFADKIRKILFRPRPVLMAFFAASSKPCLEQRWIIDELKEEFRHGVEFKIADVDSELAKEHKIGAVPTIKIFDANGRLVETFVGITAKERLKRALEKALRPVYKK